MGVATSERRLGARPATLVPVIPWAPQQRNAVAAILDAHPAVSGRCAQAARALLTTAIQLDRRAHAVVVEPASPAIYVLAKGLAVRWFHHVTVDVAVHRVDALTGPDGHPRTSYLRPYFEHPEAHVERPVEADDWEVL